MSVWTYLMAIISNAECINPLNNINMKTKQLVSCSPERWEQLKKAHEEFELSELKKRLDDEWKIASSKVKRQRIKYQPTKIVMVFGKPMKISLEESRDHYTLTIN